MSPRSLVRSTSCSERSIVKPSCTSRLLEDRPTIAGSSVVYRSRAKKAAGVGLWPAAGSIFNTLTPCPWNRQQASPSPRAIGVIGFSSLRRVALSPILVLLPSASAAFILPSLDRPPFERLTRLKH